jgi:hypothetical protein
MRLLNCVRGLAVSVIFVFVLLVDVMSFITPLI